MIKKIKERMTHLRLGDSLDKGIDMGPIVDASQKKSIDSYVQKAKEEGAEVSQTLKKHYYKVMNALVMCYTHPDPLKQNSLTHSRHTRNETK